jgi:hypothetical protein
MLALQHAGTPAGAVCVVGDARGAHRAGRLVTLSGQAVSANSTARRGLRRPSVEPWWSPSRQRRAKWLVPHGAEVAIGLDR